MFIIFRIWIGQTLSLLVIFLFYNYPASGTVCCCWLSVFQSCFFHLPRIILCLCGFVSPPLLLFIIPLLCPAPLLLSLPSLNCLPFIFPLSPSCFFPLFLPQCLSPLPPYLLFPHFSLLPAPSGISLWRWIWSRCVSTAMNACLTIWNAGWPSVNATQKKRRRNYWYPCVCDPPFLLSPHFHCSSFG